MSELSLRPWIGSETPLIVAGPDGIRGVIDQDTVAFAREIGASHVNLGGLPFRHDEFLPDNRDPYPNWSQGCVGLFRICPPPALVPYIPETIVKTNRDSLDTRLGWVRQAGLKAMIEGIEPLWLPEAVYRDHPRWRGGQCELGRIATKPYFVPNIDDPEVLDLYTQAMRAFCERYPEVEVFSFFTNDSGAGIQWSAYQYPGMNGPTASRGRDPGERLVGWLTALRAGANQAGRNAIVNACSFSFPPAETAAIRARLGRDFYLNWVNGEGQRLLGAGARTGQHWRHVPGLSAPEQFILDLQSVVRPADGTRRNIVVQDLPLARTVLRHFLADPARDSVQAARVLQRTAAELAGNDHADILIRVWRLLQQAETAQRQVRQRGGVSPYTCIAIARWLVRPLVPQPGKLTAEETAHFRPHLFTAGPPEDDLNLNYILGKPVFLGSCVTWMARWALHEATTTLRQAEQALTPVIAALGATTQGRNLALFRARIGAWRCMLETCKNTVEYQYVLDTVWQPRWGANTQDFDDNIQFDQRALHLRRIARQELDNITELTELIEAHDQPVVDTVVPPDPESVFCYGPDLLGQLRRKMTVMLDHWQEYEQLFPTSKPHEFEPRGLVAGTE